MYIILDGSRLIPKKMQSVLISTGFEYLPHSEYNWKIYHPTDERSSYWRKLDLEFCRSIWSIYRDEWKCGWLIDGGVMG